MGTCLKSVFGKIDKKNITIIENRHILGDLNNGWPIYIETLFVFDQLLVASCQLP